MCVCLWGEGANNGQCYKIIDRRIFALPCLKFPMSEDCRRPRNIFLQQGQSRIFEKAPLQGDRQVIRLTQKDSSATFKNKWVGETD